jgi:hypothetical protein
MTAEPAFPGDCYRCGDYGHIALDCPLAAPAASRAEHEGRIAAYIRRWQDGDITIHQKRRWITEENAMGYPEGTRR